MTTNQPTPMSEHVRQRALDSLRLVGSLPEQNYEDVVQVAASLCGTPMALISLIDRDHQWFKAQVGLNTASTARNMAVCDHAIRKPQELMEIGDLNLDERFSDNPVLQSMGARFYAGMPLVTSEGAAIGTVCVLDNEPRALTTIQRKGLEALARLTMHLFETRSKEHSQEVAALLEQAVAPPALVQPTAPTPYSVVILELQDLAGLESRIGGRVLERELGLLDQQVEQCLQADRGDSANRVSGSGEFVVVVKGDSLQPTLDLFRQVAAAAQSKLGHALLIGSASTDGDENAGEVYLRADEDLSRQK